MEVIDRKENPFPEDLEGRLNAVLNVVNTEFKSVTMLHLDDAPVESGEIKARIRENVGGVYLPIGPVFREYCHKTFLPIGAVAEEIIRKESGEAVYPAWRITQAGKRYGRAICVLALEYAVNEGISLYDVLGQTGSSRKTRAPLNRTKILETLAMNKRLKEADLIREVGVTGAPVLFSLNALKKIEFVHFDSIGEIEKGKSFIEYSWVIGKNPNDVKQFNGRSNTPRKVAELLAGEGSSTAKEIAKLSGDEHICSVSRILSNFVRQGFAERKNKYVGGEKLSEIKLEERARGFLELVGKFRGILSDGSSESEANDIYHSFINRKDYTEILIGALKLYRKVSPHVNQKPIEETNEKIIDFLRRNVGARSGEIGRAAGLLCVSGYLTPLVKAGVLRREKDGRAVKYYVV